MRNGWADRPMLWRLLAGKETDWSAVIRRLGEKPEEARWKRTQHGRSGRLFLHYVLEYLSPPLDLVEKLIEVYPGALYHRNVNGSLPLHEAANVEHENSVDVIKAVFLAYPDASMQKNIPGSLPIHYVLSWGPFANTESRARKLLSDRNVEVVRILLGMLLRVRTNEVINDVTIGMSSTQDPCKKQKNSFLTVDELDAPWDIVCALWERNDIVDLDDNLGKMTEMILYARYIARQTHMIPLTNTPQYFPLHVLLQEENKPFNKLKLRKYFLDRFGKQAGQHDFRRKLCLHYAIKGGFTWNDGVKAIYDFAPKALITRDEETHFYPFMISAIVEFPDLETIFTLLKQSPSVVRNLIPVKDSKKCLKDETQRSPKRQKCI